MVNQSHSERDKLIDSSFDQGDSLLNRSNDINRFGGLTQINPSLGQMVSPGQSGFRSADTPQGWVFIQKKEWTDDTWTYVVNDPDVIIASDGTQKKVNVSSLISDLEIARAELSKLKTRRVVDLSSDVGDRLDQQITAKQTEVQTLETDLHLAQQAMSLGNTSSQVDGKLTQIDIRSALSNIITRKIDWVSDHEKFTKATTSYDQSVEAIQFNRQREFIQNGFQGIQDQYQSLDQTITQIDKNIEALKRSNKELKEVRDSYLEIASKEQGDLEELRRQQQILLAKKDDLLKTSDPMLETPEGNLTRFAVIQRDKEDIVSIDRQIASLKVSKGQSFGGATIIDSQISELEKRRASLVDLVANTQKAIDGFNLRVQQYQDVILPQFAQVMQYLSLIEAAITQTETQIKIKTETSRNEIDILNTQIARNDEIINTLTIERAGLGAKLQNADTDPTFNYETAKLYAPTTFSGNAYTRYYKSPIFKTKNSQEAQDLEKQLQETLEQLRKEAAYLIEQTRTGRAGSQELLLQKQLEYIETRQQLDRLSTKISARQLDAPIAIEVGQDSFNGVIELANVSQINTTINIDGEGSASFTIENPQNIFFISQEDIDLALTEDPFLEETRTLDGMVYYRGRFYPSHIVDMLTRRKGFTSGTFNTKESLAASLTNQIENLKREIRSVDAQVATAKTFMKNQEVQQLQEKSAALQADLVEIQRQQQNLNKSLSSRSLQAVGQDQSKATSETKVKQERMDLIRQVLTKYYVSKTIFQVLDRVYIWMTSPTRTVYTLNREGTQFGIEDPSSIVMARQLPDAIARFELLQSEEERVVKFFQGMGIEHPLEEAGPFRPTEANQYQLFSANPSLSDLSGGASNLNFDQTWIYLFKIHDAVNLARETVEVLRRQSTSTDVMTGARTFDKIPFAQDITKNSQKQKQIESDYNSRYLGIEEERLQVFQGVISTVKQTYSDGKYQIQVGCRDNLIFLSMSRIMIKPALRADQGPQGTLQDPIWRGNKLSGNWKNGIVVLDYAFVNDEVRARMDRNVGNNIGDKINAEIQKNLVNKKVLGESDARESVVPYVTSLPFAKIDAANLISFIITGFPYNFELFIKNAAFGGRIVPQRTSGTTDQRSEKASYFSFLKRRIGELNDRLGDFEPYIDLGGDQFDPQVLERQQVELSAALDNAVEGLVSDYTQYVIFRMTRFFTRVSQASVSSFSASSRSSDMNADVLGKTLSTVSVDVLRQQTSIIEEITKRGASAFEDPSGQPIFIIYKLIKAVVNSAKEGKIESEAETNAAKTGALAANDTEIDDIANTIIKAPLSDLGPFQVVRELVRNQALNLLKTSTQGGVKTGSGQAENPNTPQSTLAETEDMVDVMVESVKPFVKALLTIQTDFAESYQQTSIAASNKAKLDAILPELKQYVADIRSQSASVQADIKDGPQSTIEKVVRGEKKNFLIISDQYHLDMDLQAYQSQVGSDFSLFQSEWETPLSICRRAADQVDFEFYADENGNLQFKPPTYNRILKEHFTLISETDRGVRDAILVRYGGTDGYILQSVVKAISTLSRLKMEYSSKRYLAFTAFQQLSQRKEVPTQSDVDGDSSSTSQQEVQPLNNEAITEEYENLQQRYMSQIRDGAVISEAASWQPIVASTEAEQQAKWITKQTHLAEDRHLTQIELSLEQLKIELSDLELDKKEGSEGLSSLEIELSAAKEKEATKDQPKTEEQKEKEAKIRSVNEIAREIEQTKSGTANIQSQINTKSKEIDLIRSEAKVQIYTQLLERAQVLLSQASQTREKVRQKTESFVKGLERFVDEYRIHRVADCDLISYDLTEAPPRFTYLEVTGAPDLVQISPSEYYWAGGVDYDNWRQYGYITESMQKAYFHSGDQARTYIRAMLGRERGRIFSASINVRGDSKFRVGDCVFIECLGMYFYITGIANSLSYGGNYTTSLTLAYGRRIGEIIPHPFDALGKIMIDTYQSDLEELLAQQQYAGLKQGQVNKNT